MTDCDRRRRFWTTCYFILHLHSYFKLQPGETSASKILTILHVHQLTLRYADTIRRCLQTLAKISSFLLLRFQIRICLQVLTKIPSCLVPRFQIRRCLQILAKIPPYLLLRFQLRRCLRTIANVSSYLPQRSQTSGPIMRSMAKTTFPPAVSQQVNRFVRTLPKTMTFSMLSGTCVSSCFETVYNVLLARPLVWSIFMCRS
jgi:hypothetical protein